MLSSLPSFIFLVELYNKAYFKISYSLFSLHLNLGLVLKYKGIGLKAKTTLSNKDV
jgi:hypothetical protein